MRPPSFWNFCGSFRNSMISWSSSLASSTPETSLKVTFFCELEESFARLLPNERALFPPLCICRMMKSQKPIIRRIGRPGVEHAGPGLVVSGRASILTPFSSSRLASRSYWVGAYVRKSAFAPATPFFFPVIWFPVITTEWTCPSLTSSRKSVNEMGAGPRWNPAEKLQIMIPTPMRTIQNSKLLRVEFNLRLLTALLSRVSRPLRGRDAKILGHRLADDPDNPIVPVNDERQGVAVGPGDFSVDQEVLQLPSPPAHTDRLEPIARAAGSAPPADSAAGRPPPPPHCPAPPGAEGARSSGQAAEHSSRPPLPHLE
jgi:hypothetical protein